MSSHPFLPPRLLRNPHVQNITASVGPRRAMVNWRSKTILQDSSRNYILDAGAGVRLHGELNEHSDRRASMVILFHGWEGSIHSAYMLSAAASLYCAGYDVFRLNFRDHGDSHHLNRGLFNSTLIDETMGAVKDIQRRFPRKHYFLAGFSLGGNFALRTALLAPQADISLCHAVAVCPVIDPESAMNALEKGKSIYRKYFVRKWKRSLAKKLIYFPDYDYREVLLKIKTLTEMNAHFIPRYTGFATEKDYFNAYALTGDRLADLKVDATIINSLDDPIILSRDIERMVRPARLQVETTPFGAHCAFLENYRLTSWVDHRMIRIFNPYLKNRQG